MAIVKAQPIQLETNSIIGGIGQKLILTGSGFGNTRGGSYVSFFQESGQFNTASEAQGFRYLLWSDSRIEMEMPTAFSNRVKVVINGLERYTSDTLSVLANLGYRSINPLSYDYLFDANKRGGYVWSIHTSFFNNIEARTAIEEVIMELRCKTGVNFSLFSTPSNATLTLSDTINLIAPDENLQVVGYNDRKWTSCILGQETFYTIASQDIRMSTKVDWYYGKGTPPPGKAKFRYVLQHELGHALGLGHVNQFGQTMYPSVTNLPSSNWYTRDSITNEEVNAISYFVNLSKNFTFRACGITPLKPLSRPCNVVFETPVGINETVSIAPDMYPNPTNNKVTFDNLKESFFYSINDINGRALTTGELNSTNNSIDVSSLCSGIYFIIGSNNEINWSKKLIKN